MKGGAPSIAVHNRQRKARLDLAELRSFATGALKAVWEERKGTSSLTSVSTVDVVFISDRRIAELHERFMKISGPTDVITFEHGEIFISVEAAARQARAFSASRPDELRLYLLHGLLHLAGYEDDSSAAAHRMARLQDKILAKLSRQRS